jgi:hypothetical protein
MTEASSRDQDETLSMARSGSTIEDIALYLGAGIMPVRDSRSELHNAIPKEVREQYGYEDLPDELIRLVGLEVAYLTPDHMGGDSIMMKLAAQTMLVVRQTPGIDPRMLRGRLDPEAAGIAAGSALSPTSLAAYNGVITIASYLTDQYCGNDPEQIGGQ